MSIRVGINGFGRIGRNIMRVTMGRPDIEVVAVNDLTNTDTLAYLLKYDSVMGNLPSSIQATDGVIAIDDTRVQVLSSKDPSQLPWKDLGVDIVLESTGLFTKRDDASKHLAAGAKRVIVTAPAKNPDITVVLGINADSYDPATHRIISNASCTTNCLAPVAKVLHEHFGLKHGWITTVHSYTNDQAILDQRHGDLRRARAAAENIIPTSTGAARAVGLVLPELNGKLNGVAFRVPTSTGSITDFTATVSKDVTAEQVNEAYAAAANGPMKGILEYNDEPLVSTDYKGNPHSCIIDGLSTMVMEGRMIKVMGWYDNEWGYSCRTADLAALMSDKGI